MKEKGFRDLLLLPSLLTCFVLSMTTPILAGDEQVQDADNTMVAGCAFLGTVEGGSNWGGLFAEHARNQAKKDARGDAAKLGATHIVWENIDGGGYGRTGSATGRAYDCNKRQENTASTPPAVAANSVPTIISICAGTPVPEGYIKTNDEWSPTRCGNPATPSYNVWSLAKYVDLAPGKTLEVCADAPTPVGFVIADTQWNPTRCGYPKDKIDNIKVIQRIP
jgi:hypothetical protein